MVSTIHSGELTNTKKVHWKTKVEIRKPQSVIDYNKYMMGVDLADQFLSYFSIMSFISQNSFISLELRIVQCI